jgi:glycerol-3-phosphate acyltransferase PlsY
LTVAIVAVIGSYVIGAIPFSYIAGKLLKGIDLREHGSGNLGASNTFRSLGVAPGVTVLVLDIAKGFFPVYIAGKLALTNGLPVHWLTLACAFAAVFGHMYSIYLKFSGGKGIATAAGGFLAIQPYALLGSFAVWLVLFVTRRIMSLATLSAAAALPAFVYLSGRLQLWPTHWSFTVVSVVLVIIIFHRHRSNIRRLIDGTEPALARKKHT